MSISTGAPEQLTPEQKMISKLPHEVGVPDKRNWTLALATAYVKRDFERSCTITSMAKWLHRLVDRLCGSMESSFQKLIESKIIN